MLCDAVKCKIENPKLATTFIRINGDQNYLNAYKSDLNQIIQADYIFFLSDHFFFPVFLQLYSQIGKSSLVKVMENSRIYGFKLWFLEFLSI